jgi:UDP-3-O-[3-hydroxymyristoyl] glucosamine N-acyltransferase
MADPRFYDNRGPFPLAALCSKARLECPGNADQGALVFDVAGLTQAGPLHLSFFESARAKVDFAATKAGWCVVNDAAIAGSGPKETVLLQAASVGRAFAEIAALFYPEHELDMWAQSAAIHPTARIGEGVVLAPGAVIGPDVEIGERTRVGSHSVVGRGVRIGRDCQIGPHVSIQYSLLGDSIVIQPGAVIGGSGFGFASAADGHWKIPQLGRVIVQDGVEIGANSTVDRGAIADTVIGEGSKIDNLVQIGHNTVIGRHCVLAGQVGISGSVVLGDFVILGGKVGITDHVTLGDRVRVAAMSGIGTNLEAGQDYGGIPARPAGQWKREAAALAQLVKKGHKKSDE